MKTTIEISDSVLKRSKRYAREHQVTLRSLVEEGLELVLRERAAAYDAAVEPVTFGGEGLTEEFQEGFQVQRDEIYRGRGS